MKKTLAILMAALLACACFATIGSAEDAKITAKLSEDYTNVSLLENAGTFDKLFDGDVKRKRLLGVRITPTSLHSRMPTPQRQTPMRRFA